MSRNTGLSPIVVSILFLCTWFGAATLFSLIDDRQHPVLALTSVKLQPAQIRTVKFQSPHSQPRVQSTTIYNTVHINDAPAPVGTAVTAWISDTVLFTTTTSSTVLPSSIP